MAALSPFQQYAANSQNIVNSRYDSALASYANLSPEQVAAAMIDDGTGKYNFGSGDTYDAGAYQKAYNDRLAQAQTSEGRTALGKSDLDSQKVGMKGQYDFSLTHPGGYDGGDWMDHFMGTVFPAIVGAVFVGAGMGLGGAAAGETGTVGTGIGTGAGTTGGTGLGTGAGGFGATSIGDVAAPGAFDYAGLSNMANGLPSAVGAADAGTGAAGLGAVTGSGGGGAAASIPSVTIGPPAGWSSAGTGALGVAPTAGTAGASLAGLGALAGGGADSAAAATASGQLQVPDEFINNASNAYDQQSDNLSNMTANDFSNAGSGLSTNGASTLKDLLNLGKGATSIIGAINDKNNANNTAQSAQQQIDALNEASAKAQANQKAYIDQLNQTAGQTYGANKDYVNNLNNLSNQVGARDQDYMNTINAQVAQDTANNSAYVGKLNGLSDQQRLDDNNYMQKLTGMYMPGTPEADLMQHQMDAKDAASGRNSQYGTRAVDLAGILAQQRGQLMTSNGYVGALNHTTANGLITGQGYLSAMNNDSAMNLLNNPSYQNALNGKGQTDILTSKAYTDANTNQAGVNILTSPAYANTVNNSSMLNVLTNPTYLDLWKQKQQAQNNANNSGLATASSLFSNGSSLVNSASNLYNSLFGGGG